MSETAEIRLRRLRLRSWRRGMKEMDLILGRFADACLATLAPDELDAFEALLDESDPDLYRRISAKVRGGDVDTGRAAGMLDRIAAHAKGHSAPF